MKRREFTKTQKAEMIRRASNSKGEIRCEGCGLNITGKAVEFDHIIAEALVLDKTKKLAVADGQALGLCCHRGPDGKTASDVKDIAKAKRREARNTGITKPKGAIQSAGFARPVKTSKSATPDKLATLPRRSLYQ
jgi:hypothetical protein